MLRRVSIPARAQATEPEGRDRPSGSELAGISTFFILISWLFLRLTPERFWSALGPDLGDPLFNLVVMRWGASSLNHGFAGLWNPGYFFPVKGVLALSDHLVGPAVLYRLLDAFGCPPAAAYNTLLMTAFAGSGASCYWVLRRSRLSVPGSLAGAVTWTFCGFRWSALSHLQVLLALAVPVALWLFHRLLLEPSWPRAGRFLLVYGLQMSAGVYLAMMIHIPLLAIAWVHASERGSRSKIDFRKAPVVAAAAGCAAMVWAVFAPYLRARASLDLESPLDELVPYLVTLKSYLSVGARTFYSGAYPDLLKGQAQLWPGFVAGALCIFGAVAYVRRRLRPEFALRGKTVWIFCLLLACCLGALLAADFFVLSGGLASRVEIRTAVHVFRAAMAVLLLTWFYWLMQKNRWLERNQGDTALWWKAMLASSLLAVVVSHAAAFFLLRDALPGFGAIRVPARFFVFSSLGMAALVGLGVDQLRARISGRRLAVAVQGAVLVALACEFIPDARYLEWQDLPTPEDVATEYRWLAEVEGVTALLELPLRENWREAERMYAWSVHHRPIVNGYSGHLPRSYEILKADVGLFPDRGALAQLERMGVSHLVVHLDQCTSVGRRAWRQWQKRVVRQRSSRIELIREYGWVKVYRLIHSGGPEGSRAGGVG